MFFVDERGVRACSKTDTPQASTSVISADVRKHKASEVPKGKVVEDELTIQARQELMTDGGMSFKLPRWLQDRKPQSPSVIILADSQLYNWPRRDRLCEVVV